MHSDEKKNKTSDFCLIQKKSCFVTSIFFVEVRIKNIDNICESAININQNH